MRTWDWEELVVAIDMHYVNGLSRINPATRAGRDEYLKYLIAHPRASFAWARFSKSLQELWELNNRGPAGL